MRKYLIGLIDRWEQQTIGLGGWIASALFIIFIRNSFESLVDYHKFPEATSFDLLHVPIFFFSVLLAVIVTLHLFTAVPIINVSRTGLKCFAVILVPVIIDFFSSFLTNKGTVAYNYIFENAGIKFLNFFNPFFSIPELPGSLRLEIAMITILSGSYIWLKTNRVAAAIGGGLTIFTCCFAYVALPALISNSFNLLIYPFIKLWTTEPVGATLDESVTVIVQLGLGVLLAGIWYARYDVFKCKALLNNFRWERCAHYCFLILLGLKLQMTANLFQDLFILIKGGSILLAIIFAFQFSVVVNDLVDLKGDEHSNPTRPLTQKKIPPGEYFAIGLIFLSWGLLFAWWVSSACFMLTLLFVAIYFVYSVPPFHFKRFLPLSILTIGGQALLAFLIGQTALSPPGEIPTIDTQVAFMVLLVFCLGAGVKDLKDMTGDKLLGVATIPVLMGEQKGRFLVACLAASGYVLSALLIVPTRAPAILILLALIFAGLSFWMINQPNAKEKNIFLVYLLYGGLLLTLIK